MPKRPGAAAKRDREDEPETSDREAPPTSRGSYQTQKQQALSKESENLTEHYPGTRKSTEDSVDSRASPLLASRSSVEPRPSEASSAYEPLPDLFQLPLQAIPREFDEDRDEFWIAALIELRDKLEKDRREEATEGAAGEETEDDEESPEEAAETTARTVNKTAEERIKNTNEENAHENNNLDEATEEEFETWCKCERGDFEGCSGSIECDDPKCEYGWYHWECLSDRERTLAKTWRMWLCYTCCLRRAGDYFVRQPCKVWIDKVHGRTLGRGDYETYEIDKRVTAAYESESEGESEETDSEENESEPEPEAEHGSEPETEHEVEKAEPEGSIWGDSEESDLEGSETE